MVSCLTLQVSAEELELLQALEEALVFVPLEFLQKESLQAFLQALEEQAYVSVLPFQASEQPYARVTMLAWEESLVRDLALALAEALDRVQLHQQAWDE